MQGQLPRPGDDAIVVAGNKAPIARRRLELGQRGGIGRWGSAEVSGYGGAVIVSCRRPWTAGELEHQSPFEMGELLT